MRGVSMTTRMIWSPRPYPLTSGIPRPFRRNACPDCVPAGTQSGQVFRLKGRGIPDLGGYGRGDEVVRVLVETPRKLSAQQRELIEEFARISGEEVHPLSKSFLEKVKSMLG